MDICILFLRAIEMSVDWQKIAENLASAAELSRQHSPNCEFHFCPINECPACAPAFNKQIDIALKAFGKAKAKSCSK
jgi:hypothetical protein